MNPVTAEILDELNSDIVSHGLIIQFMKDANVYEGLAAIRVEGVLSELLTTANVEIGNANLAGPDYVEFIAWKGTVAERISRAMQAVNLLSGPDKEFAYWLCLRKNIDRFEKN